MAAPVSSTTAVPDTVRATPVSITPAYSGEGTTVTPPSTTLPGAVTRKPAPLAVVGGVVSLTTKVSTASAQLPAASQENANTRSRRSWAGRATRHVASWAQATKPAVGNVGAASATTTRALPNGETVPAPASAAMTTSTKAWLVKRGSRARGLARRVRVTP